MLARMRATQTAFWEVVARCQAEDARGAHELLSRFAAHARRTNWYEGENAFSMDGNVTDRTVADLASLAGKSIRLRFQLQGATLYSFSFAARQRDQDQLQSGGLHE